MPNNPILRTKGVTTGRSSGSAYGNLAWCVAVSKEKVPSVAEQAQRTFTRIEGLLAELGTSKENILSANILLSDMKQKAEFDAEWLKWVGDEPQHWPQRMCFGAELGPGTLVEISVVAARVVSD